MPELTKDMLVALLQERVADEREGLKVYDDLWELIRKSKVPQHIRSNVLGVLNEIIAEEGTHIDSLEYTIKSIIKYYS